MSDLYQGVEKHPVPPSTSSGRTVVVETTVFYPFMVSRELVERSNHSNPFSTAQTIPL
jgi:hypothetical protein